MLSPAPTIYEVGEHGLVLKKFSVDGSATKFLRLETDAVLGPP